MEIKPRENETLTPFIRGKVKLIQSKEGYRFNIDSVLLASFVDLPDREFSVLDLGTGNGIIPILLSLKYKKIKLYAVEVQEGLFSQAWRNFQLNKTPVQLFKGDIREIKRIFKRETFDGVVFNPPYHPPPEGITEDEKSIARYEILASLKDFIRVSEYLLKPKGKLYFVYPVDRLSYALSLLLEKGFSPKVYRFVHPTVEEKATHFLLKAVKGGNTGGEVVQRPFIIYTDPKTKQYTPEVENLLENFGER
ncbi:MAG: methyltransferase [Aquificae bacterium]|nr:methyltransferase [Aquificota bacterium]